MEKAIAKKYELLKDDTIEVGGDTLYRIRALKDFRDICAGDLGGYIKEEHNLSHDGNAWVGGNAYVFGNARVYENAQVDDSARVYGSAHVSGNAYVFDCALVQDNARISGNVYVRDKAFIGGRAHVDGDARIRSNAQINSSADYTVVQGFGTVQRTTTFYKTQDRGIAVTCGCFSGTLDAFRTQVKVTRSGKIAKEYLALADLMEMHFKEA